MQKKTYIQPRIDICTIQLNRMLTASPPDELELQYTGDGHGEAGPGEIDDFQTIDTFGRLTDIEDYE